ncbi:uncharacterized protein PV06_04946 [Exophiala oligosperma]|uniref:Uncharacterized protein n=2 Tax=Chaetothyriales TaxID=34395 RepID=A0A0D2DN50_9EURO|nr:uncharacterized protein PV06_04946 [Exophiala oligosperma]KAJ9638071.1 hypothetical protein H2204_004382 [Knufia peltigerae]KIW43895.1 hypothetical protein PV06_04946 [Exophiala oligosperma]
MTDSVSSTPSSSTSSSLEFEDDERETLPDSQHGSRRATSSRGSSLELINVPQTAWQRSISACMVDPFGQLPVDIDEVTNQLLHFYGQDLYWQTAYALSNSIRPSIKGSWEYQTSLSRTHFHILMARSALHQLRLNKYVSATKQKDLEVAALKHQGNALAVLRKQVARGSQADRKEILTSTISLATFEQRYGDREKSYLHFKVARDIIKQLGFRGGLHDRLREEQALWFEGIYKDPQASFVWSTEDATTRFKWLKTLLGEVDRIWRDRILLPPKHRHSFVGENNRLQEFLFRKTSGKLISVYGDIDEGVAQQRCLLIVVCIIVGLHAQLEGKSILRQNFKALAVFDAISAYADALEERLIELDVGSEESAADLLWIMLENYRNFKPFSVNPAAVQALKTLDIANCHWRASAIANVLKYLPEGRQMELKEWLSDFVKSSRYTGKAAALNEFAFSYAGL